MKKMKFVLLFAIILALGLGSFMISKKINNAANANNSPALYKTYQSASEIYNDSDLVIKGKTVAGPKESTRILDEQTVQENIYEVEVMKAYKSASNVAVNQGDIIKLAVPQQGNKNGVNITFDYKKMEKGNYLLFLNEFQDKSKSKNVFMHASPGHLYKEEGNNMYQNVSGNGLENLNESKIQKIKNEHK